MSPSSSLPYFLLPLLLSQAPSMTMPFLPQYLASGAVGRAVCGVPPLLSQALTGRSHKRKTADFTWHKCDTARRRPEARRTGDSRLPGAPWDQ